MPKRVVDGGSRASRKRGPSSDGMRSPAGTLEEKCVTDCAATEAARLEAMLLHEEEVRRNGFAVVAGVDEAGRGPLAGPIVAGAVVLKHAVPGVNDSKQLSAAQRSSLYARIYEEGHYAGHAVIGPGEIDKIGIQAANYRVMLLAVEQLAVRPEFLLVDGFTIPGCTIPQRRLIKGDSTSLSIAAASIVAKVVRDRIMLELHMAFPQYGFDRHKGYATAEHVDALKEFGPCEAHRRSFAPVAGVPETAELFPSTGVDGFEGVKPLRKGVSQ
jgi:ribonuclease HII